MVLGEIGGVREYHARIRQHEEPHMEVEELLPREEPIRAWAGDRNDLIQLGNIIDREFQLNRHLAREKLEKELSRSAKRNILGRETKRSKELSERRRREVEDSWQVKLEVQNRQGKARKGECQSLLPNVKFEQVSGLTLSCSVGKEECAVTLSNGGSQGSSLKVNGNPQWVLSATSNVQAQLMKEGRAGVLCETHGSVWPCTLPLEY